MIGIISNLRITHLLIVKQIDTEINNKMKFNKLISNYILFMNNSKYNDCIYFNDIKYFDMNTSSRKTNDINNKKRELILCSIINNETPTSYFKKSTHWFNLKKELDKFILELASKYSIDNISSVKCNQKAGRNNNYDFDIIINNIKIKVEFKFNSSSIQQTPQFVSPMKLSQYLSYNFEEFYYDNYIKDLNKKYNIKIPDKKEYLAKIHSTNPKCVSEIQEKYYKGCYISSKFTNNHEDIEFYNYMKHISKDCILNFIEKYELDIIKLNEYLKNSQSNKIYMMYKNNKIYLQEDNPEDYNILSYVKEPTLSRYKAISKSGKIVKILIRWKNGNGVAFPAFQIS